MESVLHKVMLQYNIDELREVDDDAIDDDVSYSHTSNVSHLVAINPSVLVINPHTHTHTPHTPHHTHRTRPSGRVSSDSV